MAKTLESETLASENILIFHPERESCKRGKDQCSARVGIYPAYPGIYPGIYLPFLSEKTTRVFRVGRYIPGYLPSLA